MTFHPSQPERFYQQNHYDVYRSDNDSLDWIDIGEGSLPSHISFSIAVHRHDPDSIYITLEESDQYRGSIKGRFTIWQSRDRG